MTARLGAATIGRSPTKEGRPMLAAAHHPDHLVHSAPGRNYEAFLIAAIVALSLLGLAAIGVLMVAFS
jgi:hypothetical protein